MNFLHRNNHASSALKRASGGVTLVELMVVVTILLLLAAFAIPAMRPLTEGRRIREAARAIDVLLTQTKTRAIVNQRPSGVIFERFQQVDVGDPDDPADDVIVYQDDACNILRVVDIPPPYAGDFLNSRVRIQNWTTVALTGGGRGLHPDLNPTPPGNLDYFVLKLAVQPLSLSNGLLRWGDKVQFGFQGPFFTIVNDPLDDPATGSGMDFELDGEGYIFFYDETDPTYAADTDGDGYVDTRVLTVSVPVGELGGVSWPLTQNTASDLVDPTILLAGGPPSWPVWSAEVTFQFYRQPQPAPIAPLRLPKNTVIDLADSGYLINPASSADVFGYVFTPTSTPHVAADHRGPMILFAPNGAVSDVYHWPLGGTYAATNVMVPVFLMVGKWERTGLNSDGTSFAEDGLHNWQDASNLWVAVGPQNGFATAAEVDTHYLDDNGTPADPTDDFLADNVDAAGVSIPPTIFDSRRYARQAQVSKGALSE